MKAKISKMLIRISVAVMILAARIDFETADKTVDEILRRW